MQNDLNKIAKDILGIETLETRNADAHDFSEQPVWSIQQALEAAYKAGAASTGTGTGTEAAYENF